MKDAIIVGIMSVALIVLCIILWPNEKPQQATIPYPNPASKYCADAQGNAIQVDIGFIVEKDLLRPGGKLHDEKIIIRIPKQWMDRVVIEEVN